LAREVCGLRSEAQVGRDRKATEKAKAKRKQAKRKQRRRRTLTPKPPVVKRVDADALKEAIDRARTDSLSEEECSELRSVVDTLEYVIRELDEKNLTLRRLRSLFGLPASEKLKDVFPDAVAADDNADDVSTNRG